MKKKVFIIIIFFIIISLIIFNLKKVDKIYLDNKYYNSTKFVDIKGKDVNKLIKNKKSFALYTYNSYCSFPKPCEDVFKKFIKKNNISILKIPIKEYKKTNIYKKVKYAPSVIIFNKGKIVSYLNANLDKDKDKYQEIDAFEKWFFKYVKNK